MKNGTFCTNTLKPILVCNNYSHLKLKKSYRLGNCLLTWIKNPPDSMKVITVTDANVVAFFTSMNAAPIISPRPCIFTFEKTSKPDYWKHYFQFQEEKMLMFDVVSDLSSYNTEENCKCGQEECHDAWPQANHEIDNYKENHGQYEIQRKITDVSGYKICTELVHAHRSFLS